jgi:hypothetical protein
LVIHFFTKTFYDESPTNVISALEKFSVTSPVGNPVTIDFESRAGHGDCAHCNLGGLFTGQVNQITD